MIVLKILGWVFSLAAAGYFLYFVFRFAREIDRHYDDERERWQQQLEE